MDENTSIVTVINRIGQLNRELDELKANKKACLNCKNLKERYSVIKSYREEKKDLQAKKTEAIRVLELINKKINKRYCS